MKNKIFTSALILIVLTGLQSCAVVGGIFKAGTATGVIAVVVVIGIVVFIIAKMMGGKK